MAELIQEDVGCPSDQASVELAVNQCLRVLRRHGVTGAVVAAQNEAVSRGAVVGQSDNLFLSKAMVPDKPNEMVQMCCEVQSVVSELKSIATAFRNTLESCKVVWEEKNKGREH